MFTFLKTRNCNIKFTNWKAVYLYKKIFLKAIKVIYICWDDFFPICLCELEQSVCKKIKTLKLRY